MRKSRHTKFLIQWLLHGLILLAAFNISSLFLYWVRVQSEGNYLMKQDGQYVTLWDRFVMQNFYQDTILMFFFAALLAEAGLHYAFRKRKMLVFIAYCAFAGFCWLLFLYLHNPSWPFREMIYRFINYWFYAFGYVFLYTIFRDFFIRRARDKNLALVNREAELRELRNQVNPHFFFNTLNSVYGLALEEQAVKTSAAVEKLSEMMRYSMKGSSAAFVSLKAELDFVRNYLDLQKLRVGDEIKLDINITDPLTDYEIAPLLLIPFIENSFQYGISRDTSSFIRLSINVTDGSLYMDIINSVNAAQKIHGHGTGISNTRRRLDILYPDHQLQIIQKPDSYQVTLTLNLNSKK